MVQADILAGGKSDNDSIWSLVLGQVSVAVPGIVIIIDILRHLNCDQVEVRIAQVSSWSSFSWTS